jgi:hypothetical protein
MVTVPFYNLDTAEWYRAQKSCVLHRLVRECRDAMVAPSWGVSDRDVAILEARIARITNILDERGVVYAKG